MITYLNEENLPDLIGDGNVLIDFYADWCGPCQILTEELEELTKEKEDIKVIKVDVDAHEEIAADYKIMSIPALFVYKEGNLVKHHVGYAKKDEILEWFK